MKKTLFFLLLFSTFSVFAGSKLILSFDAPLVRGWYGTGEMEQGGAEFDLDGSQTLVGFDFSKVSFSFGYKPLSAPIYLIGTFGVSKTTYEVELESDNQYINNTTLADDEELNFIFGIGARYYVINGRTHKVFVGAKLHFEQDKDESRGNDTKDFSAFGLLGSGGYDFMVNQKFSVGINGNMGYVYGYEDVNNVTLHVLAIDLLINVTLHF